MRNSFAAGLPYYSRPAQFNFPVVAALERVSAQPACNLRVEAVMKIDVRSVQDSPFAIAGTEFDAPSL